MGLSAAQYLVQLQALLPQGAAWPRDPGAVVTMALDGLSQELARVDQRFDQLVEEANPRTTSELLLDWERVAGLPDECAVDVAKTTEQRRAALLQRLTSRGGQSRAYFIAVAALLGFPITITEFDLHTCEHTCDVPIYGEDWMYAWQINVLQADTVSYQTCMDTCETPLASWGNAEFECVIGHLKPAHTLLIFTYAP